MARPMLLIQEKLLSEMYSKYEQGVPVLAILRQTNMVDHVTAPTLTKLLSYVAAMENAKSSLAETPKPKPVKNRKVKEPSLIVCPIHTTMYNSLYPQWLVESASIIKASPKDWYYTGKMPLGQWVKRTE